MADPKNAGSDKEPGQSSLEQYLLRDPEAFARNMARLVEQAGKAASAWVTPREKGMAQDSINEPLADMVKTFSKLSQYWLGEPSRALEAQTRLFSGYMGVWLNAVRRLGEGEPAADPAETGPGDRRFQDPEWGRNAFFDFVRQAYLVTSRWAQDLVEEAEGLDEHTRHKAQFYVRQIASAMSPSNFILTNPEVFRETMATNGENLVRGMSMLAEDIEAGGGELRLRQADSSKFAVGENLATTPGKVVARSDVAEIIQYEPVTKTVLRRPLLVCPPWINKYYILDLTPKKSFIAWALAQGHTIFVISWVNPDERHADKDWDAYWREGIQFAMDAIVEATGESQVNVLGYCVGGTLLAAALARLSKMGDQRVRSATFLATQVDFEHAGDLKVFVDQDQIAALERAMSQKGYLEGTRMATAFNMLRSSDLIWPYVVNNYMRGKNPLPFDLLYWNADSTRMSAANHSFYLRNCYLENRLSRGEMVLDGQTVSLGDITIPVYNVATREDHIAPAKSVFAGCRAFGGDVTFVMSGSGHIAGIVNHPDANKYQYWSGGKPVGSLDEWLGGASETAGSWWPHWQAWIEHQDNERVDARHPGQTGQRLLGDAPGDYVLVRF